MDVVFPGTVDSAAAEHVAATVVAVEEFGVKPTSKSPPDVHFRRTLLVYDLDARGNDHRGVLERHGPDEEKKEVGRVKRRVFRGYRIGDTRDEKSTDSYKVRKTWRPSHGTVDLTEDIPVAVHGDRWICIIIVSFSR